MYLEEVVMVHSFGFLHHTAQEVDKLLAITRQYVRDHGDHDRQYLVGDARLAYTVALSNITLKLLHSKSWLDKMYQASVDASTKTHDEDVVYPLLVQLHAYATEDQALYGYLPKILVQLSHASLRVYDRVKRLDMQVHEGSDLTYDAVKNNPSCHNVVPITQQWSNPGFELGQCAVG